MAASKAKRKAAEAAFERLLLACGKRRATAYNDIGGWELDYADCYGGFRVEEIINKGGAVRTPLGDTRMDADEFVRACYFLREAVLSGILAPKRR